MQLKQKVIYLLTLILIISQVFVLLPTSVQASENSAIGNFSQDKKSLTNDIDIMRTKLIEELQLQGIDENKAEEIVGSLTEDDLKQLENNKAQVAIGGNKAMNDVFAALGVIFLILLIAALL